MGDIGGSPRHPLGVIGSGEESIFMENKGIEEENKILELTVISTAR